MSQKIQRSTLLNPVTPRVVFIWLVAAILLTFSAPGAQAQGKKHACCAAKRVEKASTIKGEIVSVLAPVARLKSENKEYIVHLAPVWYWRANNLELRPGKAEITGKISEDKGITHLYAEVIVQGKNKIALVDANGRPKWAAGTSGGMHDGKACMSGTSRAGCCRR